MTPPERFPPDDPREWMNRARSNLVLAGEPKQGVYLEDLCFDAQQAAEKAIKAVMLARGVDFPYVHDLAHLLGVLEGSGETIPDEVRRAELLSQHAWAARYPGGGSPVTPGEHSEAVALAEAVVSWAERCIG